MPEEIVLPPAPPPPPPPPIVTDPDAPPPPPAPAPVAPVTIPFTLVDQHGQVVMRGNSMVMPELPGMTGIVGTAPENHYRGVGEWLPIPAQPSDKHVFDWETKTWSDPRTVADRKDELKAAATAKRWAVENGGITLPGGVHIKTGKADQDRITSVIVNWPPGVEAVDFKADSGWITLSLAQIQGIAGAIALHVQACFSIERIHHEAIDLLDTEVETEAYDVNTIWPT